MHPIGDVYGRYDGLITPLHRVEFTSGKGTFWLMDDLVVRGPGSPDVLCYVKSLGGSVCLVLDNHDLHLPTVFVGTNRNKPKDRLTPLLGAPDVDELPNWLRRQPLLQIDEKKKLVMVYAGIMPWQDLRTAKECTRDVEVVLSSDSCPFFLDAMHGDMPNNWSSELRGLGRLRFITNAFIRMRFCFPNSQLDIYSRKLPEEASTPLRPWSAILGPAAEEYNVAFDYWALPGGKGTSEGIYMPDTSYCWDGTLIRLCWEGRQYFVQPLNWHEDMGEGEAVTS